MDKFNKLVEDILTENKVEIISQGNKVIISTKELADIRKYKIGWLVYQQYRLTRSHKDAITYGRKQQPNIDKTIK